MTWLLSLPSIGRTVPRHLLHWNKGSKINLQEQFLWTQWEHPSQLRKSYYWRPSAHCTWILSRVTRWIQVGSRYKDISLAHFTQRSFASNPRFHLICSFLRRSSSASEEMNTSLAYRCYQVQPVRNSRDKASSTMMKRRGLHTEPWWTPTWTLKLSLSELLSRALLEE